MTEKKQCKYVCQLDGLPSEPIRPADHWSKTGHIRAKKLYSMTCSVVVCRCQPVSLASPLVRLSRIWIHLYRFVTISDRCVRLLHLHVNTVNQQSALFTSQSASNNIKNKNLIQNKLK